MKKRFFYLMMLSMFAFSGLTLQAQDEPATNPDAIENVAEDPGDENVFGEVPGKIVDLMTSMKWYDFLNIILFTIFGYLSPFIPGLRKIGDTETRVFVGAIIIIMIFASMNVNAAWKLALEFLASTKLYDYIFKLIKKTPDSPKALEIPISA